jgi:hypothetical protein
MKSTGDVVFTFAKRASACEVDPYNTAIMRRPLQAARRDGSCANRTGSASYTGKCQSGGETQCEFLSYDTVTVIVSEKFVSIPEVSIKPCRSSCKVPVIVALL